MASVVAPGALLLNPPSPNLTLYPNPNPYLSLRFSPPVDLSNSRLSLSSSLRPYSEALRLSISRFSTSIKTSAASSSTATPPATSSSPSSLLSDSTRTVSAIVALAVSLSKYFLNAMKRVSSNIGRVCVTPTPDERAAIQSLRDNVFCTVGPLFFAAASQQAKEPLSRVSTPVTVIAAGMSKWLQLYDGILVVRVLLSWFPNVPWDRQPLSAIRDLCDPYLNLFRNIIPPVFDTLDVSPIPAFMFLGFLSMLLGTAATPRRM